MDALNVFLTTVYPYIAVAIFLIGSWIRFDREQYSWRAASSQLLSTRGMWLGSNVFHVGILALIIAHIVGMVAFGAIGGGALTVSIVSGVLILLGGGFLLLRRLANARVRTASKRTDLLVIAWLVGMAVLGLVMTTMTSYAPTVIERYPESFASYLESTTWLYKLHRALGWTILVIFPFTRLVHIWSIPLTYISRSYQIVRARR